MTIQSRLSLPVAIILVGSLVALVHQRHDFVLLEAEAFALPKPSIASIRFSDTRSTELNSMSASSAYLESISYTQPTSIEEGLLSATGKYLDALSSISNQLYATSSTMTDYYYDESSGVYYHTGAHTFPEGSIFSQGNALHSQFAQDFVHQATQEYATAINSLGGETTTFLAQSAPNMNMNPEETIRELSSKLDQTFFSFRDKVSSSTDAFADSLKTSTTAAQQTTNAFVDSLKSSTAAAQQSTNVFAESLKKSTTAAQQSNSANTLESLKVAAKQQQATMNVVKPEALSSSKRFASEIANQATRSAVELDKAAIDNTLSVQQAFSETAKFANHAIANSRMGVQNSLGYLVDYTNQGIDNIVANIARTTSEATSSLATSTNAAKASVFQAESVVSKSALAVQNTVGDVATSVGVAGTATKAALATANSASAKIVPGVALSASQGFGFPGDTYNGGGDVAGLVEMVVASVFAIPRAIMDALMMENNPNFMRIDIDKILQDLSAAYTNDFLEPLQYAATQGGKGATTPLDQAQATLHTLQMLLAFVVAIPRAVLEGLTGETMDQIGAQLSQVDVRALAEQLAGFAAAVSTILVSLIKVTATVISFFMTQTGLGQAISTQSEEAVSRVVSFVINDLLPAILDGLLLILQQFAMFLMEGASTIMSTM